MKDLIVVRGAGDLATGVICRLFRAGFLVMALESSRPSAIRRKVALSEAVYDGTALVEDVVAKRISHYLEADEVLAEGKVPVLVDREGACIKHLKPIAVIDAIIAKKNFGTNLGMAPITIALGPGFHAGKDVDAVIETMRGHDLGRIIYQGEAAANTGIPGKIGGYDKERVIHAPGTGMLKTFAEIGDIVEKSQIIAKIGEIPVPATIDGVLRGLIRNDYFVTEGFKIADIDPRKEEKNNCFTISDKARALSGSVLEALLALLHKKQLIEGSVIYGSRKKRDAC